MSFTAGQCSYSLHYQPASKNQQHHLLLQSDWEPISSRCWSVVRPLFDKTHNYLCLYSVVLYCVVIHLARALCSLTLSYELCCLWKSLLCLTHSCRWNNCIQIEIGCDSVFFFLSHTIYLGTIMTSSSSKLEMKQMSIHFRKWWNIDFCLLVQCSLDFGHFCNGSKGGMPLTNTLQFMHLIDCSFNKTRSAALTWVFGSSNLPPASFYRGPV